MAQYRPRGVYKKTNRDSWISTVWYNTKKEAEDFAKSQGVVTGRYTKIRIIKK
jgi:hypothetical protein